jgi:adenylate cyclase
MDNLTFGRDHYHKSAHRFADHYHAYAQAHQVRLIMLDEELDNILLALDIYKQNHMWSDIIDFVLILDDFLETRGYWSVCQFWLEQIVDHNEVLDNPVVYLQILHNLADVTSAQGDLDKAKELYQEVIKLAEQANDKTFVGSADYGLFSLHQNQGRLEESRRFLEQVPALAQQTDNQAQEQIAGYFLETINLSERDEKKLPQILNLVRQIAKTLGQTGQAHALSMRAWVYLRFKQYGQARRYYLKALAHVRQNKDAQGTAFILYQLGLIAALENDLKTAMTYFQESRVIAEQINQETGLLHLYSSIGLLYLKQESFHLARPYLEQSVTLANKFGDRQQVAENLYWLGYVAANTGEPAQAEHIFRESLAIYTRLGSPEVEKVENTLAQLQIAISHD